VRWTRDHTHGFLRAGRLAKAECQVRTLRLHRSEAADETVDDPDTLKTTARAASKEIEVKKIAYLASALCLAFLPGSMKADTLTLNGAATGSTGPYQLTLDGTTPVNLFCLDDFRTVHIGETWTVTVVNGADYLTSNTHSSDFKYEEEAYIYSMLGVSNGHGHTYNATDVQDALWYIFDHSADTNSYANSLVSKAGDFHYTGSFLDDYSFYIPTGRGDNLPQEMIGTTVNTSPTPEPSSLFLFGSGLVGLAGAVRRKLARA
jgi:PEP-CTERM motif